MLLDVRPIPTTPRSDSRIASWMRASHASLRRVVLVIGRPRFEIDLVRQFAGKGRDLANCRQVLMGESGQEESRQEIIKTAVGQGLFGFGANTRCQRQIDWVSLGRFSPARRGLFSAYTLLGLV